eukprot:13555486-Ditylum_brightwellii.AAC.1
MTSWLSNKSTKVENRDHENGQVFNKSYEQFISACGPTSDAKGEVQALPSAAQLVSASKFGKPNLNHQFSLEVVTEYIFLPLFKSGLLDGNSTSSLTACHPLFHHLYVSLQRLDPMDFSSIAMYNEAIEQQTQSWWPLPPERTSSHTGAMAITPP